MVERERQQNDSLRQRLMAPAAIPMKTDVRVSSCSRAGISTEPKIWPATAGPKPRL